MHEEKADKAEKAEKAEKPRLEKRKPEKEKSAGKLDKRKSISMKLRGLEEFARRGRDKGESSVKEAEKSPTIEAIPEPASESPRKFSKEHKPKSLPFLAIETIDSESRGRSGSFTMVNPLAAQVIIPSPIATEMTG